MKKKPEWIDGCMDEARPSNSFQEMPTPTLIEKRDLKRTALILVNRLYELAELTVNQRQSLNDKADEIVVDCLLTIQKAERDALREWAEKKLKVISEYPLYNDFVKGEIETLEELIYHLDEQDKQKQ